MPGDEHGERRRVVEVTRDVDPSRVHDLLERPPRASLTIRRGDAVHVEPVIVRLVEDRPCCGVQREAGAAVEAADEVVLLADGGWYWFQLRGISLRGRVARMDKPPTGASPDLVWFQLAPRRTLAWDYAAIREERTESGGDPDVAGFLAASMVVEVATLSKKGNAFVTPLWFVADRGKLYITTGMQSRAGRNIATNPAVVLLFTGERLEAGGHALRMHGIASGRVGLPPARVLARIAWKYYASPLALRSEIANMTRWRLRLRYYGQLTPGYLEVLPQSAELVKVTSAGANER